MHLSLEQAQLIVDNHSSDIGVHRTIITVVELPGHIPTYAFTTEDLARHRDRVFLLVLPADGSFPLPIIPSLLSTIRTQTGIPIPTKQVLDDTRSVISYPFILFPSSGSEKLITLADALPTLSVQQLTITELKLGSYISQLHEIQNDFFGYPITPDLSPTVPSFSDPTPPNSYSWQETFTSLLDTLIHTIQSLDTPIDLPYQEIQTYLSRAIAFFHFDDVEVPSLTTFLLSRSDIFLSNTESDSPNIQLIIPRFCGEMLYADPLMEYLFSSSPIDLLGSGSDSHNRTGPSNALMEGYGKQLIVFPRQKIKRIWYDLYFALRVLYRALETENRTTSDRAMEEIKRCVKILRDAPCY